MSEHTGGLRWARTCLLMAVMGCGAASAAHAQSSVNVFGTVDLNLSYTSAGGAHNKAMDQGGNILPSRLGFRGTEDLGDGLSAGFWLEHAFHPDSGGIERVFWHRRSTVSLAHRQWGEARLGRDYTPTFWNISQFAPFGTVGVGGSSNIVADYPFGIGGNLTLVRSNNSVGYHFPRSQQGGFYGQAMWAPSEGVDGARYTGTRVGYAVDAFDVALAYGETQTGGGSKAKISNIGGSYTVGPVRLMGFWFKQDAGSDDQVNALLGLDWRVGVGNVKFSVANADRSGPGVSANDARQLAVGYVHNLSRRTALYGFYSKIDNRGESTYVTADSSPPPTPGGSASGLQFGITHNF